ncbi:FecCD family ABC transporter permease [Shouchella tritolerans]|uniref:FecCD family ABC transporter permease n=1 Tax=Shouchella tritolerans TaxID=2979466 RepID=UPI0021E9057A|nr:iron ABC transporter permease [Shouchella tritolerans]
MAAIGWCSLAIGAKSMEWSTVIQALFQFDPGNTDHQVVWRTRLPRFAGAALIGASLAVSGALMQGITRNYLASPSIMGVTDGSLFMITILIAWSPGATGLEMFSLVGSAVGAGTVFGVASLLPNGFSPVRLAILGTIMGMFLGGVAQAIAVYFQVSQNVSFWYSARLHQMEPSLLALALPFCVVGTLLALSLSRQITALALGDEVSAGIGQRTRLIKRLAFLAVVILTGISVALAGKIAFVGLAIPHIARFLFGYDYRKLIPASAILGAMFLPLCDVASRLVNFPFETPVGIITSLVGVPFLLYLIKTKGGKRHAL